MYTIPVALQPYVPVILAGAGCWRLEAIPGDCVASGLLPSQEVVAQAFVDPTAPTFLNKTRSYKKAHPRVKDTSAAVRGHETLSNVKVAARVQQLFEQGGITKEWVKQEMVECLQTAKQRGKLETQRAAIMDVAKLEGYVIDKQEVTSIDPSKRSAIRDMVDAAIKPVAHG